MLAFASLASGVASGHVELFHIERSTNRNVVVYDLRLLGSGGIDTAHPVHAYWRLFAEDGRAEELTWLETQFAYGFSVQSKPGELVLRLTALAHRPLHVRRCGARFCATLLVAGKSAVLDHVWVQTEGAFLGPRVEWVELYGADARTGERLTERIVNH